MSDYEIGKPWFWVLMLFALVIGLVSMGMGIIYAIFWIARHVTVN